MHAACALEESAVLEAFKSSCVSDQECKAEEVKQFAVVVRCLMQ